MTDNGPTNKSKSMGKFHVEADNELPFFERSAGATGVNGPRLEKIDTIAPDSVIAFTVEARCPFRHVKTAAHKKEHVG